MQISHHQDNENSSMDILETLRGMLQIIDPETKIPFDQFDCIEYKENDLTRK